MSMAAPEKFYDTPTEEQFAGSHKDADDLEEMAEGLIERHNELSHLADYEIVYLWRKKGGKSKGRPVFGNTQLVRGLMGHFTKADAVIWLSADHVYEYGFSEKQVEAALYHQMLQLDEDDEHEGAAILRLVAPDVHIFSNEIEKFGTWWPNSERFRKAATQLELEV
jgi:hypothetical protein